MTKFQTKHYVVFESPGTLFSETTSCEISEGDPRVACGMAEKIVERHGARPYGFHFETRREAGVLKDDDGVELRVEPKTVKHSGTYFINGTLRTLDDVIRDNKHDERVLRSNMESNDYPIVCETRNSYLSVRPFEHDDFVVDLAGKILRQGSDPELVEYRDRKIAEHKAEMQRRYGNK